MKKILTCGALMALVSGAFAADGEAVFKKCAACHGQKAEKSYLNKVAVLTTLEKDVMVTSMKEYKAGERNTYGTGAVMKGQMATLSDEDMEAVAEYITTLK